MSRPDAEPLGGGVRRSARLIETPVPGAAAFPGSAGAPVVSARNTERSESPSDRSVTGFPRHPRILDPVIVWGHLGTIAMLLGGVATIDADDDIRLTIPTDRLHWDSGAWALLPDADPDDEDYQRETHDALHPDTEDGCAPCEDRAERVGMMWQRMTTPY